MKALHYIIYTALLLQIPIMVGSGAPEPCPDFDDLSPEKATHMLKKLFRYSPSQDSMNNMSPEEQKNYLGAGIQELSQYYIHTVTPLIENLKSNYASLAAQAEDSQSHHISSLGLHELRGLIQTLERYGPLLACAKFKRAIAAEQLAAYTPYIRNARKEALLYFQDLKNEWLPEDLETINQITKILDPLIADRPHIEQVLEKRRNEKPVNQDNDDEDVPLKTRARKYFNWLISAEPAPKMTQEEKEDEDTDEAIRRLTKKFIGKLQHVPL